MRAWKCFEYAGLSSWHADRQRLAVCHAKFDDIGAVAFGTVDHYAVLATRRSYAHLRRSFDQSSSAFSCHRWCIHVLHFEPIGRATRTVGGILALRDDALKTHLAGMGENGRAVAFDMLIESNARSSLGHDRCERSLADLKRIAPQAVAVQLDQVEGV